MTDILERLKNNSKVNGAYPRDIADAIKEIVKLRSMPMKYKRMEFNARLQKELDEAYQEIARLLAEKGGSQCS